MLSFAAADAFWTIVSSIFWKGLVDCFSTHPGSWEVFILEERNKDRHSNSSWGCKFLSFFAIIKLLLEAVTTSWLLLTCVWCYQELHSTRSSFEQARFNLVGAMLPCISIHCSVFCIYIFDMPFVCLIYRWLHFQTSRLRKDLNFWRLLVGQWMHIFVISNKYGLSLFAFVISWLCTNDTQISSAAVCSGIWITPSDGTVYQSSNSLTATSIFMFFVVPNVNVLC